MTTSPDVIGDQPIMFLGLGDPLCALNPFSDVAPRQDDEAGAGVGAADVVVPRTGKYFVVVADVVEDQGISGFDTVRIAREHPGSLEVRHRLQHGVADEFVSGHRQVCASGAVDVAVDEVDDQPALVTNGLQEGLRIEHCIRRRPQLGMGSFRGPQRPRGFRLVVENPGAAVEVLIVDGF
jgi:hypothetical protein